MCFYLETYFDIRVKTFNELLIHTLSHCKKIHNFKRTYKDNVDDFNKSVGKSIFFFLCFVI